jgi:sn-glycerol 3-phosphate transport system substrate-binding protein
VQSDGPLRRREFIVQGGWTLGCAALTVLPLGCRGRSGKREVAALWFSYGGRNRQVLEKLVDRFNRTQTDCAIKPVFQGDYYEGLAKLRLGLAAQAGPSVSHVIGEVVPYLAEAGVLEDLTDYSGAGQIEVVPSLGQAGSWVGGADRPLVALPFNRSTPIAYLNGDIFARRRLGAPRTWEELREVARALTVRRADRTVRFGFECPVSWWFWVALVNQAGSDVVDSDGRVTLGGIAGTRALRFWQTLTAQDRSMKRPAGREASANESTNNDFLAGRAAMIWNSTAFLKYLEDHAAFPVVAAPLPADRCKGMPTGGTHFVLLRSASLRSKQAAWEFLRWMMQTDQVIEWATSTGYMPVTLDAVRRLEVSGYYARHPNDRVAYDQLDAARPWPWSTDLVRIAREIVQPELERAVVAGVDAATALARARASARRSRGQ